MKVTATIDRWDLVRLNVHLLPRMRANWIAVAAFSVALFCALTFLPPQRLSPPAMLENLVWALGGAVLAIVLGAAVCIAWILSVANQKTGVLGEHEFEIRSDGLFERTSANEGLNRWKGIQSVSRSGNQIHVRINAFLWHVIPRHGFKSDEEFHRYFELLRQRWQSAA
jgi:hypothetical protein